MDKRIFRASKLELETFDNKFSLTGYIPYYSKSDPGSEERVGRFATRLKPGMFAKSLQEIATGKRNVFALYYHEMSTAFANTGDGSLTFTDFPNFLRYKITADLSDPDAHKVMTKVKNGNIGGTSFGLNYGPENVEWTAEKDVDVEWFTGGDLFEVSPCPADQAAFSSSKVMLKSANEWKPDNLEQEWEQWQHNLRLEKLNSKTR